MILLPFPFDNAGKSRTGKISIRPAEVRDTRSEVDSESVSGFKTFAFSGSAFTNLNFNGPSKR